MTEPPLEPGGPAQRWVRVLVLLVGLVLPQVVLYGPSLSGRAILLPLDLLTKSIYLYPADEAAARTPPQNAILYDEVQSIELRRQFATAEVRAGRLPLWNPYTYCGAPFLAANNTAVLSPFRLLDYAFPGPETIAWVALLRAAVAGVGAYLLFRRALGLVFWPSALAAWCFPLTGFLVGWLGYPPSHVALWLPWMLLAVDRAVRRPLGLGGPGLAVVTAALLVSGHAATAAQVLLGSGLYFVWRLGDQHGWRGVVRGPGLAAVGAVLGGWFVGFLLSAPQTLPTIEYLMTSTRVASRGAGEVETSSQGWSALPQLVLPYCYGHHQNGLLYLASGNRLEHAAAGYAGLLLTLVLAPLAWLSATARRRNAFWLIVIVFSLGQVLALPGLSTLFELPPLSFLRNNRLVLLTGFAFLALGATGLDALWRQGFRRQLGFTAPVATLVALAVWSFQRAATLPGQIVAQLQFQANDPRSGERMMPYLRQPEVIASLRDDYWSLFAGGGALCLLAVALWTALWLWRPGRRTALALAVLAFAELLWNARGVNPQCDPKLYYPRLPALQQLAAAPPGRVVGSLCLPPSLTQTHALRDLRGYDGADPDHLVRMLDAAKAPQTPPSPPHARTSNYVARPSPIAAMLGLRYVIHPGSLPQRDDVVARDAFYTVVELPNAMPRVWVPRRVEVVPDLQEQFARIDRAEFDPAAIAYVDSVVPFAGGDCRGTARIVDEIPSRITVDVDLQTPGVVVLADLWMPGWHAYLDGSQVPVHRTDFGVRSAELPAGKGTLEFRYEPGSFTWGLRCLWTALAALLVWVTALRRVRRSA